MANVLIKSTDFACFWFSGDGFLPNSALPVLVYRADAINFKNMGMVETKEQIAKIASNNEWYLDWVASIYRRPHYHSTAHEALIIFKGTALLQLGGNRVGKKWEVVAGNVIFIPAGVGHQRIRSTDDFTVFGLYPVGQKWDLQWGWRKNYASSLRRIKKVPLPKADPIFGKMSPLLNCWQ